jgi:glc operon protein GlcG
MTISLRTVALALLGMAPLIEQSHGGQLAQKKVLTLDAAKQMAAAAEKEAIANKWNMWIVILDDGGNYLYVERMDNAQLGSFDVATGKARSAVYFKRPSKGFADAVSSGQSYVLKVPNAMPIEGGIPLMDDGKVIGAIGVSGATAQQDGVVAKAGADVFTSMVGGK